MTMSRSKKFERDQARNVVFHTKLGGSRSGTGFPVKDGDYVWVVVESSGEVSITLSRDAKHQPTKPIIIKNK